MYNVYYGSTYLGQADSYEEAAQLAVDELGYYDGHELFLEDDEAGDE